MRYWLDSIAVPTHRNRSPSKAGIADTRESALLQKIINVQNTKEAKEPHLYKSMRFKVSVRIDSNESLTSFWEWATVALAGPAFRLMIVSKSLWPFSAT